jgi:flavin reductase (DIM6/NTAB) family NADH-FMN oxidoreductase RutF
MECRLFKVVELGLHTQFIGEIMDVKTDDEMLDDRALPDVDSIKPVVMVPEIRRYYGFGEKLGNAFVVGKRLRGR